jgi:hypothetical protein
MKAENAGTQLIILSILSILSDSFHRTRIFPDWHGF